MARPGRETRTPISRVTDRLEGSHLQLFRWLIRQERQPHESEESLEDTDRKGEGDNHSGRVINDHEVEEDWKDDNEPSNPCGYER